jgi:hypothetical protein
MVRFLTAFIACEALLAFRWYMGRGFLFVLILMLAVKYLLLQLVPVYYGYGYLFLGAWVLAALHVSSFLANRRSVFGNMFAIRGLVNPWHPGSKLMRLWVFKPKTTLLVVEPLTAAAYGAWCYTTPMDGPFWLPWVIPVWPPGFVYDQALFEQMLVFGQAIPVLIPLALFVFNKLEWQGSFEAFGEMAQQSTKPKRRWFARKPKTPPAELTFPLLAKQSTKAGPRSPSVAEMARRLGSS